MVKVILIIVGILLALLLIGFMLCVAAGLQM